MTHVFIIVTSVQFETTPREKDKKVKEQAMEIAIPVGDICHMREYTIGAQSPQSMIEMKTPVCIGSTTRRYYEVRESLKELCLKVRRAQQ
jgi:hypothetical protein